MKPFPEKNLLLYLKEISKYQNLTPEEEKELLTRVKEGDTAAREKIILAYQKLILSISKNYLRSGIPLLDLINEGNIALMEAIRDFNPQKQMRFPVFARLRINYRLINVLEEKKIIKIPPMKKILMKKLFYLLPKLAYTFNREPTVEELATSLNISPMEVEELFLLSSAPVFSLNQKEANSGRLSEILSNFSFPSPEEILKQKELREEIEQALQTLNPREREVIEKYFGLIDGSPQTLQKIGEELGVSREFVRQIKKRALKKLRHKIKDSRLRIIFGFE